MAPPSFVEMWKVTGNPYPFYEDQWHVYATGAFLLTGKPMYLMAEQ